MRRNRHREAKRSIFPRRINLTEREISADLHFPSSGSGRAGRNAYELRAGRR